MTDDDEDLDWDEWMQLSEEEAEARVEAAGRQYEERWKALTPLQQYRVSRRMTVETCLGWRKVMRSFDSGRELGDFFDKQLRIGQKRLVRLRIERATGIRPGTA